MNDNTTSQVPALGAKIDAPINVAVISAAAIARNGLADMVERAADCRLVAVCETADELNWRDDARKASVAIVCCGMDVFAAESEIQQLQETWPDTRVIILANSRMTVFLKQSGANGCVPAIMSDLAPEEQLMETVRAVHTGEVLRAGRTSRLEGPTHRRRGLSLREREVLQCIVNGASNASIAESIGVTRDTVTNHVRSILRKMSVKNRTHAAIKAVAAGLVELPDEISAAPHTLMA